MEHIVELKIQKLQGSGLKKLIFSYRQFPQAKEKIEVLIQRYKLMQAEFKVTYNGTLVFDNCS